jgi:hypothetical protein
MCAGLVDERGPHEARRDALSASVALARDERRHSGERAERPAE